MEKQCNAALWTNCQGSFEFICAKPYSPFTTIHVWNKPQMIMTSEPAEPPSICCFADLLYKTHLTQVLSTPPLFLFFQNYVDFKMKLCFGWMFTSNPLKVLTVILIFSRGRNLKTMNSWKLSYSTIFLQNRFKRKGAYLDFLHPTHPSSYHTFLALQNKVCPSQRVHQQSLVF